MAGKNLRFIKMIITVLLGEDRVANVEVRADDERESAALEGVEDHRV